MILSRNLNQSTKPDLLSFLLLKFSIFEDVFHAPPIPNGISFGHSLKHNEMQPQITKKPSIFQQYSKMPNKMQNSNQSGHKYQKMFMPSNLKLKQSAKVKIPNKNSTAEQLDPKMAKFEEDIEIDTLFDFDDEEKWN